MTYKDIYNALSRLPFRQNNSRDTYEKRFTWSFGGSSVEVLSREGEKDTIITCNGRSQKSGKQNTLTILGNSVNAISTEDKTGGVDIRFLGDGYDLSFFFEV